MPSFSVAQLAARCTALIEAKGDDLIRPRIIVTISGIPGSGKTTLANAVASALNSAPTSSEAPSRLKTVVVSMDGFHLPRSQLDEEGLRRRGAPHTFNADAVVALVADLRMSTYRPMPDIMAPSFDHAIKDPIMNDVVIPRSTNIIILEGNYLLLKESPWNTIQDLVNESWLLECTFEVAEERLARRHLAAGIVDNIEDGLDRVRLNDQPNGQYLLENGLEQTITIQQG